MSLNKIREISSGRQNGHGLWIDHSIAREIAPSMEPPLERPLATLGLIGVTLVGLAIVPTQIVENPHNQDLALRQWRRTVGVVGLNGQV